MQRGRRLVFLQWRSSQIKSPPRDVRDLSLSFTKFSFVSFSENRSPPSTQSHLERWSLVFFTRPGNSVPLEALVRDSSMIAAAVDGNKEKNFNAGATAGEWFSRRQSKWRLEDKKVMILTINLMFFY